MSGKFGDLIRKARETEQQPEDQNTGKPETQKTSQEVALVAEKEKDVNLSIKVPESLRRHWAAESKRIGVSMTAAIIEALTERFGTPK
ncbi:MAG: hypothetical protein KME45_26845 [Stenomitos rutilans HA7619-LM2]|jgi:hypothetical protein|nr:hypothetical protein [Stenomitos rutilans HA7619-LM2]